MKKNSPYYFAVAAVTIDGFIARYPGHSSAWTSKEDKVHLHKMEAMADVLLLGHTSFEIAKKNLLKHNCIVLTSKVKKLEQKYPTVTFLNPKNASLEKFIENSGFKKICILGGRGAYNYCLKNNLVDGIFLTIEPIMFGKGITMFDQSIKTKYFKLVLAKKLNKKGTLLLQYSKK